MDKVMEAVQVVVDRLPALVVGGHLEHIDRVDFFVERRKFLTEFPFEVSPVVEAEKAVGGFEFELSHSPLGGAAVFHKRHCPDNLLLLVVEGLRTEADVSSARR